MKSAARWLLVVAVAFASGLAATLVIEKPLEVAVSPVTPVEGVFPVDPTLRDEPPPDETWIAERRQRVAPRGSRRSVITVIRGSPPQETK
jgi:hypothetical protein